MKKYKIHGAWMVRPEYFDLFFDHGADFDPYYIASFSEIKDIANEWGMKIIDLLKMMYEI